MDNQARHIDVLLFDRLNILDVAGPVQAFSSANQGGGDRYRLRFVSAGGTDVTASCGLRLGADAVAAAGPDTQDLLVPGGRGVDRAMDDGQIRRVIAGWQDRRRDRRVISICSGALVLAAAGLLDGRKATTHWSRSQEAVDRFPQVQWSTCDLYHIDGAIMTSAGVTSGIDLALEIIRRDHGPGIALSVARELVVYLKRTGGQHQFADLLEAQFSGGKELNRLIAALHAEPGQAWTLDRMADVAGLTPRTLSRHFTATFDNSPLRFLERLRVKRAADALNGGAPVGKAIEVGGFTDFQKMQRAFRRQLGTTVGRYREQFGGD